MSIVIHGNNFVPLQQGQEVQNVINSSGDDIMIKFNDHYFVPGQYLLYVEQLIQNNYTLSPSVNENINPNTWLKMWKHFTNYQQGNVVCCACGQRRANVGGHVILHNQQQNRRVNAGANSVCIIPICGRCNSQDANLTINTNIQAVKLFDYYNSYGEQFITYEEEHQIQITHIRLSQRILRHIQNVERNGNAFYGQIERQGRHGRQGRI